MPRRNKQISIHTLKPSPFGPPHKKSQFRSHAKIKSISIPYTATKPILTTHKNKINFDIHTKTELFSARTQRSSQYRPPAPKRSPFRVLHWNQFNFDLPLWNQVNFDHSHKINIFSMSSLNPSHPTLKSSQFWSPTLKSSQFRPPTRKSS